MKKYTANYAHTNHNFVIQNLKEKSRENNKVSPLFCVLKNILQRGSPTMMSKYLQSKLGEIHKLDNFEERFFLISTENSVWYKTIKGDEKHNYYPAKNFFEKIIPEEFGKYSFIQPLIIPEMDINEITGEENEYFVDQSVDFYIPLTKLVIEIDGQQHKTNDVKRVRDKERDEYLLKNGVKTIRITTQELRDHSYDGKIGEILNHFSQFDSVLKRYSEFYAQITEQKIKPEEINTKLIPTAILRFQILLLELLMNGSLSLNKDWKLKIYIHEELKDFPELACKDLLIWCEKLYRLKNKVKTQKPNFDIKIVKSEEELNIKDDYISINFSLFKRYTDENEFNPNTIFIRTDYFDSIKEKNYFRVSTSESINYQINSKDKKTLEFFLRNIFDKTQFRTGQFHIISNSLNLRDTVGLLPTGGGKSLCYQLPCLLQPSINFVVCPIKSLMYDQEENLKDIYIKNINYITSDLLPNEKQKIQFDFETGKYFFIFISPEKFQIPSFRETISSIIANFTITYAVIDEIHCISEWGHDFRTSYLNLAKTIDKLSPRDKNNEGNIKFLGLTATAAVNVLKDIKAELSRGKQSLEEENVVSLDYSRKELDFKVVNDGGNKKELLGEVVENIVEKEQLIETTDKACLIFTPNVNGEYGCYTIANKLNTLYENKVNWFSGKSPEKNKRPIMNKEEFTRHKLQVQKDFKQNVYPILVATKAFGMGIDKQNIFYTIHYGLPSSVEALYQEAGRAGRWDTKLDENKNKTAKCYVLHSPETSTIALENLKTIFKQETKFSEIDKIREEVGRNGCDIFKQIFLFLQGQNDIDEELEKILKIKELYFKENTKVKIFWSKAYKDLSINSDKLEKLIYRLSLLGVVKDWTTDFKNYYEVEFSTLNEKNIKKTLVNYIVKYEESLSEKEIYTKIEEIKKDTLLEKSIYYLLTWIFDNIVYKRKQSLKNISELCYGYKDSESFKKSIDGYFQITEKTFIIQHITENPKDFRKWFEVLLQKDKFITDTELLKLKDSLSRFLESYRNNFGLNFLSGFVRLKLDDYENSDGRDRLETTLKDINSYIESEEEKKAFFAKLFYLSNFLSQKQQVLLGDSLKKQHPEVLKSFAEYYKLPCLLNDEYIVMMERIKFLRKILYGSIYKI